MQVKKPSAEDKRILSKLFPSTASSVGKFNPKLASCAEKNKLKKKAAIFKGGKYRTITAVLFKSLQIKFLRVIQKKN